MCLDPSAHPTQTPRLCLKMRCKRDETPRGPHDERRPHPLPRGLPPRRPLRYPAPCGRRPSASAPGRGARPPSTFNTAPTASATTLPLRAGSKLPGQRGEETSMSRAADSCRPPGRPGHPHHPRQQLPRRRGDPRPIPPPRPRGKVPLRGPRHCASRGNGGVLVSLVRPPPDASRRGHLSPSRGHRLGSSSLSQQRAPGRHTSLRSACHPLRAEQALGSPRSPHIAPRPPWRLS
jgi:hypothetical protein